MSEDELLDRLLLADPAKPLLFETARRNYADMLPQIGPEAARRILAEVYGGDFSPGQLDLIIALCAEQAGGD